MIERWEYLTVLWVYKKEEIGPEKSKWTQTYWIYRPGDKDGEERHYWSSEDDPNEYQFSRADLLTEFGSQGWDLVTETVADSVIFSTKSGWTNVGTPIRERLTFKRPIED